VERLEGEEGSNSRLLVIHFVCYIISSPICSGLIVENRLEDRKFSWNRDLGTFAALSLALYLSNPTWAMIAIAILLFFLIRGILQFVSDPYGTFHIALNGKQEEREQTQWVNMGYWKVPGLSGASIICLNSVRMQRNSRKHVKVNPCHFWDLNHLMSVALAEQVMLAAHCAEGNRVLGRVHHCILLSYCES
jgi:hypothetical protein